MTNALRFSPEGGEVRVSLRREGSQAIIDVADDGQGISADFLPHLFEPFRQAEGPLTRKHGGLGVGLSIAKQLVELHGGTVSAASPGLGRGAVFTVCLSLAQAQASAPAEAPPERPRSRGLEGQRMLIVEDDADTRRFLKQLAANDGAEVTTASNTAEAWASLEREAPDLLLCDLAMPGEDGCDFLRRVRSRSDRLRLVPAAALTVLAREEDRVRAIAAGFQVYLAKPSDPPSILRALQTLAGRR